MIGEDISYGGLALKERYLLTEDLLMIISIGNHWLLIWLMQKKMQGYQGGRHYLEAYGIRYIITTPFWVSGHAIPLVNELMKDKDWILVFSDSNSMVFVKDLPENYHIIKKMLNLKYYIGNRMANATDILFPKNRHRTINA